MTIDEQDFYSFESHEDVEEQIEAKNHAGLMRAFSRAVDETHSGKIVHGGIHTPAIHTPKHWYRRKLTNWLHAHLLPESVKLAVEKRFGNFVIIRETGEYHYEAMPLYTRIGMHLLFTGHYRQKAVETDAMHKLFLYETNRQGTYFTDPKSVSQIPSFVEHYNIEMQEYVMSEVNEYKNFNEFFTRAIRSELRPIAYQENPDILVSSADCRLNVFTSVSDATKFWIKGKEFTLGNLLKDEGLTEELEGGSLAIFRLAPQDYHRWHSPAGGVLESIQNIEGTYYTVNPCLIKEDVNVFTENHRQILTMRNHRGSRFAVVAVGALLVGSIVLTNADEPGKELAKGDEMGYFQYGGSTVIAVFPKDTVVWDPDLLQNSEKSLETKVVVGEKIGTYVN
ncbi:hypothetical protein DFQ28_007021 [Apophysomyces sp. BC1034]|nr:hypothetical protein DFQ30_008077 [Apophysomyces sp. BC1015]KAG0176626.1 hypothetical protein DFQ29_005873 [Apophysomyces sp. BC1021]KAG0187000.1 hypothetical protein DFQ28_007021 [Apophysomyces sp. BC1034]